MLERPSTPPRVVPGARPPRRTRPDVVGTRPVAAVTAALWAAAVGLVTLGVVVTIVWAVSARGGDGLITPITATGVVWLAAHHAPIDTPSAAVTLLPLLLLALPLLLLQRAGRWAARVSATTDSADAGLIVVAGTAAYATVAFLVAQGSSLGGATVSPTAALLWSVVVSAIGLTAGVIDGAGLLSSIRERTPQLLRAAALVAAGSGAALAVVVGTLASVALAARWSTVTGLSHQLAPSAGDAVGVLLVSLAYLPNLLVWTLSYVVGPGFGVGGGATVDPFYAAGGLLPGMPVLGAVPTDAPAAGPLLLLLPVVAGIVGSLVLRRRMHLVLVREVAAVLGGAALLGVATALLAAVSSGSLGDGRLVGLGPSPLAAGAAASGLVAAGAVLWTLVVRITPTIWVTGEH